MAEKRGDERRGQDLEPSLGAGVLSCLVLPSEVPGEGGMAGLLPT